MATYRNDVVSTTLTTSLGATPGAGDTVIIGSYAIDYVSGNLGTADLALVEIGPGFKGSLAIANGGQLICEAPTGKVVVKGSTRTDIRSTSAAGVIDEVWVQTAGTTIVTLGTADMDDIYLLSGILILESDADIEALLARGGQATIREGSPVIPYIENGGAVIRIRRDYTAADCMGGLTIAEHETAAPSGTVNIDYAATYQIDKAGTHSGAVNLRGVMDLRNCSRDVTFSGTTTFYYGHEVWISDRTVLPTFSTPAYAGCTAINYVKKS